MLDLVMLVCLYWYWCLAFYVRHVAVVGDGGSVAFGLVVGVQFLQLLLML